MSREEAAPKGGRSSSNPESTSRVRHPLADLEAALGPDLGRLVREAVGHVDDARTSLLERPARVAVLEYAEVLDRVGQALRMWIAADDSLNGGTP